MPEPAGPAADRPGCDAHGTAVTQDALLAGRVRLLQPGRGHRAGTDAVLLAALARPGRDGAIADFGAATGAVGLIAAARCPEAEILLVERDPGLIDLCRENVRLNGLENRARVVEADLLGPAEERRRAGLASGRLDLVLTNPPYLDAAQGRLSPDPGRAAAHVMPGGGLRRWIAACADALRPKGRLGLIHRADRLGACLQALGSGFGGIAVRSVHPRANAAAVRILIEAVKGSRAPLALLPPLVLHGPDGRFTEAAAALAQGAELAPSG